MRPAWLAAVALAAACSGGPVPAPAPAPVPPPPAAPVGAPAPAPDPAPDLCGASRWRHLLGRPRSEIPVPVRPQMQRVACTTCPVTMDFNALRLNFFFDARTGLIEEIRCG